MDKPKLEFIIETTLDETAKELGMTLSTDARERVLERAKDIVVDDLWKRGAITINTVPTPVIPPQVPMPPVIDTSQIPSGIQPKRKRLWNAFKRAFKRFLVIVLAIGFLTGVFFLLVNKIYTPTIIMLALILLLSLTIVEYER